MAYIIILASFFLMPFLIFMAIFLTLPLVNFQKNKKIQNAVKKSKQLTNPIKV